MIYRLIAAKWAEAQGLSPKAFEGSFTFEELLEYNARGYNSYYFPNYPSDKAYAAVPLNPKTNRKRPIKGSDMDTFEWVFIDLDMKDYKSGNPDRSHDYETKDAFLEVLLNQDILPTRIVDSGNGVHAYWRVLDLDPKTFLRLNRRLCRLLRTDPAVSTLNQLMRVPNTLNVKHETDWKLTEVLWDEPDNVYYAETLANWLPALEPEDEKYCNHHYDSAHEINTERLNLSEKLPEKFLKACRQNKELHGLFYGQHKDRSAADFRLAHLLLDQGFSKEEATTVLYHTSKATERAPMHRYNYANNIIEKIWTDIQAETIAPAGSSPIKSVKEILAAGEETGIRFSCNPMVDGTTRGFRLGDVFGLIGGSGNGKTTIGLNFCRWFTEHNINRNYIHVVVTLEQPEKEIAARWDLMSAQLKKDQPGVDWDAIVHILGNHNPDGTFRELGLSDIEKYIIGLEKQTGKKVGCVIIDHIGILKQKGGKNGEMDGLIGVCKQLKSFALSTNTFTLIQSQTSRAKNNGGDVELDMDAAFGTSNFEFFADFIMTTWQPLKRIIHDCPDMTVLAWKMAKIRHKKILTDQLKENVVYGMMFDPASEMLREMTTDEYKKYEYLSKTATVIRNKDRKKEPSRMAVIDWVAKPKTKEVH